MSQSNTTELEPGQLRPGAPRNWGMRERDRAPMSEEYQMVCGHYQKLAVYRCDDCNLAPLSLLKDAYEVIRQQASQGNRSKRGNEQREKTLRSIEDALGWFQGRTDRRGLQ